MLKKVGIISGLLAMTFLLASITAYAAEQSAYHHDTQSSTADYYMSVYDVSIDMSECIELGNDEEKIQAKIIATAQPTALIQDNALPLSEWKPLPVQELRYDFSQFRQAKNLDGYTVTVSAPAIKLKDDSTIAFKVYVTDNKADVYATIHFANNDFTDMKLNITKDNILSISNLDVPIRDGYTFLGWYLDENCTVPFLLPNEAGYAKQIIEGDLTLFSKWKSKGVVQEEMLEEGEPLTPTITEKPLNTVEQRASIQNADDITHMARQKHARDDEFIGIAINDSPTMQTNSLVEKERIPIYEYFVLVFLTVLVARDGFSIAVDLRILKWYAGKKAARRAEI